MKNLHEIVEYYASKHPLKTAIRFLERGEEETQSMTYLQLQQQAKTVASMVLENHKKGDTALLVFDASIDVIVAFWGCVYAGIIAVPIPVPSGNKGLDNVAHIMQDANIQLVMSHELVQKRVYKRFNEHENLKHLDWMNVQSKDMDTFIPFETQIYPLEHHFLLQYTSGSTSKPKGVQVSHSNMLAHQEALVKAFYSDENSVIVSWLPYYHDMGLIGKIIHATFCGGTLVMMPPIRFVQKPIRWLNAISTYKATNSAAPNFAFEDCIRIIDDEQLKQLDLSSWKAAWNAAEPVHASTIVKFAKRFKQCGFNPKSLIPAYGMAESTLIISTVDIHEKLNLLAIDEDEFKQGNVKVLEQFSIDTPIEDIKRHKKVAVDCGQSIPNHHVKIVNPSNCMECENYKVGEVWFNGGSVATGYLNKQEVTQETFYATIQNNNSEERYLRTGDLGFFDEKSNLYIVGRNKDMLIVHGENYAPQDIEFSISSSHDAFKDSGCSVFSVMSEEEERVVVIQEIKRTQRKKVDFEVLLSHVKSVLSEEFQLQLFGLVLIPEANLPKTSSGKVQRSLCKQLFLDEQFSVMYSWQAQEIDNDQLLSISSDQESVSSLSYDNLICWLEQWIKKSLPSSAHLFEKNSNFSSYGMDSKVTALMAYDLEDFIGYELDPTLCWNYPNPDTLINHLLEQINTNQLQPLKG
jgi:acyl-CoA synthetase (AMP-forming)/AMP-acid ligase II/acyl carrier protein